MTTTEESTDSVKRTHDQPNHETHEETTETHDEFMNKTGRRWATAFRARMKNGWERTKKFGKRTVEGTKKAGSNTVKATKSTGRFVKKSAGWIAVGVYGALFGVGKAIEVVGKVIFDAIAYVVLGVVILVAVILIGIAALVAYACWLIVKVLWLVSTTLMTPFEAWQDRRNRRTNQVPVNHARSRWQTWRESIRPTNLHNTNLTYLRSQAAGRNRQSSPTEPTTPSTDAPVPPMTEQVVEEPTPPTPGGAGRKRAAKKTAAAESTRATQHRATPGFTNFAAGTA